MELLSVRAARWAVLASLIFGAGSGACTSLNSAPPVTGNAGAGGAAAGSSGEAGAGGGGGGGTTGAAGAAAGAGGTTAGAGGTNAGAGGAVAGAGGANAGTGGGGGAPVEPPGLIAYWRFNEGNGTTVADASGNGQAATLSTGGAWTQTGHQGSAVVLDGANEFARFMPQSTAQPLYNFPTVPLTFSAWIRPSVGAAAREFATAVARSHEDYAFQDFWLGLVNGKPSCTIHSPYKQGPVAGTAVPAGTWTHIACTYGLEGIVTLYVNGVATASMSTNQLLGPIQTAILIGASETSGLEDYFPGAVDDVRMYNATLTDAEVMAIAR